MNQVNYYEGVLGVSSADHVFLGRLTGSQTIPIAKLSISRNLIPKSKSDRVYCDDLS